MKQFKLLTALLLVVALFVAPYVSAATEVEATYDITRVEVNDITAQPNGVNIIYVERGETARVEVYFAGYDDGDATTEDIPVDNVKVKAWIGGYEHGDIKDTSEIFEIEPGVDYKKTLRLDIPEDMDANDDYTLYVEIYDDDNEVQEEYVLRVQEKRHYLKIQDVIFNPGYEVKAGHLLISTVRVENLGDKKEEDIKVTMSIPELGLSTRTYIDELVAHECGDDDCDEDEEDSASSDELFLTIPENVDTGLYELVISVEYDRGHEVIEEKYELMVLGGVSAPTEQTTVSVDLTSQEVTMDKGAVYKFSIANLGSATKIYSVEVVGEEGFATSRVDPNVITVGADQTGELFVFVSALETATEGKHLFTARVMSDDEVVKEITLEADVAKGAASDWSDVRRGLEIGFVVLLIILVILGIVLVGRKIGKSESGMEEPMSEEGQSYY